MISRFHDRARRKTGARAYHYSSTEERLEIDGLEDIFEHMARRQQDAMRPYSAVMAKDEAIRRYLQAKRLSVNEILYIGDSFHTSGSDLPILDVDGILAIQVKDSDETLTILRRCLA